MIKFHFCKTYLKSIKGQSHEKPISNKFEELQNRTGLSNSGTIRVYGNGLYSMTLHSPDAKVILQRKDINGSTVYFVRDYITVKDEGFYFNNYVYPGLNSGTYLNTNELSQDDIQDFIEAEKLKTEKKLKTKPERPPAAMVDWLNDYRLKIRYDIFETEDWVKYALSESKTEGMRDMDVKLFSKLLDDIVEDNDSVTNEVLKSNDGIDIIIGRSGNLGIVYSKIMVEASYRFVLYNAAHLKSQSEYWQISLKNLESSESTFDETMDSLARNTYRAYPRWTIKNDDLWFVIQKNDELSNLSLTQDQLLFFKDFSFPYYINGQAGSGKSTMLYYLFSNAYYYKCQNYISGNLIFLTENKFLLDHTKKAVFDLLSNNPEFDGLSAEQISEVEQNFSSFKDFLIGQIPDGDKENFQDSKYLNYARFKELYDESYIKKSTKKKYTAEESWFTITTYIYGYDSLKKITSQDYVASVYNKSQKIPQEKFEGIEKTVLPFYEKLIDEDNYWDKLKVIRYLEYNEVKIPKYSLVVCDEAQDFCRVELRFILKLSAYLDYDLSNLTQIPIVFAGDPNQTVNPTGFREREMTEMLHTELKELSQFNYKKEESVYNPKYNYRSKQPVVTLANFIQYYRKKKFDIRLVKPQIPKRPEDTPEPVPNIFFSYSQILGNSEVLSDLVEKIKYKIFVVPSDNGDKGEYVEENEILSNVEGAEIKTAIEAKGAEYNQVVLYGFGEHYLNHFEKSSLNQNDNDVESFRQAYFFNKLYVGITRAQKELIIIDSEESQKEFWEKLVNHSDVSEQYWDVLNDKRATTIEYNPNSLKGVLISSQEDARENAIQDKMQGLYNSNPSRLKVAANQFFKIGEKKEYYNCLAIAEELRLNWKSAAEYYLKLDLKKSCLENAARCFFHGQHFSELRTQIGPKLKTSQQDVRLTVSQLMVSEKIEKKDLRKLSDNREILHETMEEISWHKSFIEKLVSNSKILEDETIIRELAEILNKIVKETDLEFWNVVGQLNYRIGNYSRAIKAWDRVGENNTLNYVLAKIELTRDNQDQFSELIWLNKLADFKEDETQKGQVYSTIIKIFESINNFGIDNKLFYLYAYKAYLVQKPEYNLMNLGTKVEKDFKKDSTLLIQEYSDLLNNKSLVPQAQEYVVQRWFKLKEKMVSQQKEFDQAELKKINDEYRKLCSQTGIKYFEYKISDINNISELPEKILFHPPNHLENIEISNFRRFKSISLNQLGMYNLILGDNNIGKTSLLEALLFDSDKDILFRNLAYAYSERRSLPRYLDSSKEERFAIPKRYIDTFFNNSDGGLGNIKYSLKQGRSTWEYSITKLSLDDLKDILTATAGIDYSDYYGFIQNKTMEALNIPIVLKNILPSDSISSPLIPFGKGFNKDLAQIYSDRIDKIKATRKDFLSKMKIFIPKIERIVVDTESGEIIIEENDKDIGTSLNQYGEGANKLFRILVQITLQAGKKLLIDEVDAGIHHSRFSNFWSTILQFAEANDTQIFATTHNLECIKTFDEILKTESFESLQEYSRVITLRELPEGNVKAYVREFNEFNYELENDIELRGN